MSNLANVFSGGFDPNTVEPQAPMDDGPLPAGVYTAEITGAEVKPLKSGNGTGLSLEFTVIDPEQYARRKVWQNLNIQHSNHQAEQIGQSQLSTLCRVLNIGKLTDSDQLFGQVVRIRTKIRPAQGEYGPRAEVAAYEQAGTSAPPQRQSAPTTAPAAAGSTPPWKRRAA
jgi:hypothetical protein